MEDYSAIKKNGNNSFCSSMLDLETVILSKTKAEVMMLLICGMQTVGEILTYIGNVKYETNEQTS